MTEEPLKAPCFFNHSAAAHTCECFCNDCINADDKFANLPFYRREEIMAQVKGEKAVGGSS